MSYLLVRRHASGWTAIGAVCVLLANELFLAQSTILLPEMLLTFFVLAAIWAHVTGQRALLTITLTAAMLTKESGAVIAAVFLAWPIILTFCSKPGERAMWLKGILPPAVAVGITSIHFLFHYRFSGWFFYPGHTELITLGEKDVIFKAKWIFERIFEEQGMQILTLGGLMIAPMFWSGVGRWRSLLIGFLAVAVIKVLWARWPSFGIGTLLGSGVLASVLFFLVVGTFGEANASKSRVAGPIILQIMGYWLFCALNFLTDRYLLSLVPCLVILASISIWWAAVGRWPWVPPTLLISAAVLIALQLGTDGRVGDTKLSYVDDIAVHRQLVEHCDRNGLHDEMITGSFMDQTYMTDPRCGYTISGRIFPSMSTRLEPGTAFAIIDPYTTDSVRLMMTEQGFKLVQRFEHGPAWVELHGR